MKHSLVFRTSKSADDALNGKGTLHAVKIDVPKDVELYCAESYLTILLQSHLRRNPSSEEIKINGKLIGFEIGSADLEELRERMKDENL